MAAIGAIYASNAVFASLSFEHRIAGETVADNMHIHLDAK
jgi:hypothetical protein